MQHTLLLFGPFLSLSSPDLSFLLLESAIAKQESYTVSKISRLVVIQIPLRVEDFWLISEAEASYALRPRGREGWDSRQWQVGLHIATHLM
jgi:hypothetical protein